MFSGMCPFGIWLLYCPDAAWFIPCMGEKRGVVPWVGCSPSAGCCQLLVSCFLTNCLCWSYAGQSWKQCAPGHFLYGDFREKQNWKTSHNTQVVLFVFFPPFSPWRDSGRTHWSWELYIYIWVKSQTIHHSWVFPNSVKNSPLWDLSGYGEIHLAFPKDVFEGRGWGETFFPPDSRKCIVERHRARRMGTKFCESGWKQALSLSSH